MKLKSIFLCLTMSLSLGLVGCSSNEPKTVDTKFIKSLEKAVDERWDYVEGVENGKIESNNEISYLKKCVDIELAILDEYREAEFSDATLRKLMLDYMEGLDTQLEAAKYYDADYSKYDELWSEGFDLRTVTLNELVDNYALKVNKDQLDSIKNNAQIVNENKSKEKEIEEMVKSIEFKLDNSEYGWKDYSAVVENTTSQDFDSFYLNIKFVDADGITVDTTTASADDWKSGEKVKFTFMTDAKFEEIQWDYEYYNN